MKQNQSICVTVRFAVERRSYLTISEHEQVWEVANRPCARSFACRCLYTTIHLFNLGRQRQRGKSGISCNWHVITHEGETGQTLFRSM